MRKPNIDFNKSFKYIVIIYAVIFIAGIAAACFGIKMDINFVGGTKISYSYTGDIDEAKIKEIAENTLDTPFNLSKSNALAGNTKTFELALSGKNSVSAEKQEELTEALSEEFKDNEVELYTSNSVDSTIAGSFFAKSIAAVLLTAAGVVCYVGIRFRSIGGVSAAVTALCALVLDVLVAFSVCVIFRLQIDSNFIAVVLTLLGYSLNDTIVIYDRVRENKKTNPELAIGQLVNMSINQTLIRNVVTTVTTFLAVATILAVSELYGLESLRTFAIPMAFGLVSGGISSLFIAGPLWVLWKNKKAKKA